jgi:hypothetical protein
VRFAVELGYDVTVAKDATADYSEEFMHAALVTNLPNYASSIVSSRQHRLSHVYLKDRLATAKNYRRIAGYFRSSIFELVAEEINSIDITQEVTDALLGDRPLAQSSSAMGDAHG